MYGIEDVEIGRKRKGKRKRKAVTCRGRGRMPSWPLTECLTLALLNTILIIQFKPSFTI